MDIIWIYMTGPVKLQKKRRWPASFWDHLHHVAAPKHSCNILWRYMAIHMTPDPKCSVHCLSSPLIFQKFMRDWRFSTFTRSINSSWIKSSWDQRRVYRLMYHSSPPAQPDTSRLSTSVWRQVELTTIEPSRQDAIKIIPQTQKLWFIHVR